MSQHPPQAEPAQAQQRQRLAEFDYLRALAIIVIVLGHSVFLSEQGFPLLLENLLRGGTGVFVFISGFFFHRVFYPRFAYRSFMAKKLRQIFIPFIAISLLGLGFRSIGWALDGHNLHTILLNCWYTARNGYVLFPHWYIPFILLTFACSPLYLAYIQLRLSTQLWLLAASIVLSLVLQRPDSNINQLQALVYFAPFYLMGILVSIYQQQLAQLRTGLLLVGLILVGLSLWLQTYVFVHVGNYHKFPLVWGGLDLQLAQKIGLCLLLLLLCQRIKPGRLANHLHLIAELSFPIFFVHPLLSMAVDNLVNCAKTFGWQVPGDATSALLISAAIFIFLFYGSLALIIRARARWGDSTRWLIG